MALPILRRYSAALSTTAATPIVTAVGAGRALVISKILVSASSGSTVTVTVGGAAVVNAIQMGAAQVYTETGLVLATGETITATAGTANALTVSVFGEEVDN